MAKKTTAGRKTSKAKKKKRSPFKRFFIKLILGITGVVILSIFLLFLAVYGGVFGKLPGAEELKNIKHSTASEVYSSDNKLIGRYFIQNRSTAKFDEIPPVVIDALIATEDSRFLEHEGIDFLSIARVIVKTLLLDDESSGGGSTISQQLIKNVYGRKDHSFLSMPVNKLKENITALKLEEVYSKEEVITLYLNTVTFGENVYGIKAAGMRFFNKVPSQLNTAEAATLIGMLKAPTSYNPRLYPQKSKQRRNVVLSQMVKYNKISEEEGNRLMETSLKIDYTKYTSTEGVAPYLRDKIKPVINTILKDIVKPDGSNYDLNSEGLKVYTTINSIAQNAAEQSVKKNMQRLQETFEEHWNNREPWGNSDFLWNLAKQSRRYKRLKASGKSDAEIKENFNTKVKTEIFTYEGHKAVSISPIDSIAYYQKMLQCGMLAVDRNSGAILAWVGGVDFASFPYDHVTSKRQVGSTFKPIVYAAALEKGIPPCEFISNEREVYEEYDGWSPGNSDSNYDGFYSLAGGLAKSVNTISVKVLMETGIDNVINLSENLGIDGDLPEVPSLALGTANISLYEMVRAYTAFNNNGYVVEPYSIERIENAAGEIIWKNEQLQPKQVLSEFASRGILKMMEMVVDSGTGQRMRRVYGIDIPLAGKTGTTQNNSDGWFMACTPDIVCGAWVGAESPLVRFRSTSLGQGAATALPLVGSFISSLESNSKTRNMLGSKFPKMDNYLSEAMDCELYKDELEGNFFKDLFEQKPKGRKSSEEKDNGEEKKKKKGFFRRLFGN